MQDQTIFLTGAARRLGAAIAEAMHGAGARVVIHYRRSRDDAERLAATLNARRPGSAQTHQADLADRAGLAPMIESVVAHCGRLDGLVNNASAFYPTPVGTITTDQVDELFASNFVAPLFLSQAAAPHLAARNGFVLNMVDIYAARPLRDHAVYSAAKAALASLTRSLARELGPKVRVNGIAPGPVLWPEHGMSDEARRKIVAGTALKRAGSPKAIADAALYLAQADYVTGQILAVDGGRSV